MEAVTTKQLKVGDLAKQTGKSVRALRLYEELDLLHPVARSGGGFRLYDETAVTQGLARHKVRARSDGHCARHLPEETGKTRQAIVRHESLARELERTLQYLRTSQVCHPPRTTQEDCPHCPEDHGMKQEPALVAGFHTERPAPERIALEM